MCRRRSSRSRAAALVALAAAALAPTAGGAATLRTFTTSGTCSGDLGGCSSELGDNGVAAGNNLCQDAATAVGLTGGGQQFVAWVSDSTSDAYCNALGLTGKLGDVPPCGVVSLPAAGPWVRLDGIPFAMSLADIVGDGPLSPAQIDEHGTTFGFLQDFATGTNPDGTLKSDYSCSDWADGTSASSWSGGTTDATDTGFASGASSSCGPPLHLLCLELGSGDAVPYPHLAGALAFVTNATGSGDFATWSGSGGVGGIVGGNAVCRHLARLADLPSPDAFVAWLSDAGADAVDALVIDGPWRRIDGIPVADSVADLTDHTLRSSLGIDETGARSDLLPWTGTLAGGTASGDDCAGWTDGTVGAQGESGRASRASGTWSEASTAACNGAHPIYCFGTVVLLGWDNFERGDFSRWSAVVE